MPVRNLYPVEKQNMIIREKIEKELTTIRFEGQIAAYEYLMMKEHRKESTGIYQVNTMIFLCFIIYMGFLIL
jgi:hypothetical protein